MTIQKKAFPSHKTEKNGNVEISQPIEYGMDLRDWFAGQALMGFLTRQDIDAVLGDKSNPLEFLANGCYKWADAMIKAREQND